MRHSLMTAYRKAVSQKRTSLQAPTKTCCFQNRYQVRELINVDEVKHDLAINKAIDFIKSHANVVEKAAEAEKTEDAQ